MMKRIGAGCGAAEHSSRVRANTNARPDISLSLKTRLHQFILNNKFALLCLNFAGNIFKGKSY
jgi:hypothetical protein